MANPKFESVFFDKLRKISNKTKPYSKNESIIIEKVYDALKNSLYIKSDSRGYFDTVQNFGYDYSSSY